MTKVEVDQALTREVSRFAVATLPREITTTEQFEAVTDQQAQARAMVTKARRYFDRLLEPAREAVKRITAARDEFTKPLIEFDKACTDRASIFVRRERTRIEQEQREARERELAAMQELAALSAAALSDEVATEIGGAIEEMIEEARSAPIEPVRVASASMTTVITKSLQVVDVTKFCQWIANHDDPQVAEAFAEELTAAARRYQKRTDDVPDGCEWRTVETLRRR